MANSTADDVRAVTGWSTGQLSDAVIGSLINLADARIEQEGLTGTAAQLRNLSSYLTAHYGELRLRGNTTNFGAGGTNITFGEPTAWLQEYERFSAEIKADSGLLNKIYGV